MLPKPSDAAIVIKDGEIVVDLLGGTRDKRRSLPWMADTLVPVFSSTKAVAALVIAWLVENDRLSYDDEIQELWPEFAAHGKGRLTIAQILSHQSGLSGLTEEIQPSDWYDNEFICSVWWSAP